MSRKTWPLLAVAFMLLALALAGCATRGRISIRAQRAPTLDTTGIQRIAVMPFAPAINTVEFTAIANRLTDQVTRKLQATGAFTMVSPTVIHNARARGESIEPYVDALFTGRVTGYSSRTGQGRERRTNRNTGTAETHIFFIREVHVAFEYYLVRTRDGTIVGPVTRTGSRTVRHDNLRSLMPENTLAMGIVSDQLRLFYRDVIPHTVRITRALDRERDRALRPRMDVARAQIRAGDYVAARRSYIDIWESYRSIAAAVNASILYEAVGEIENAVNFMRLVFAETGAPRANQILARLNREMEAQLGFAMFHDMRTPAERVADHAVGEIEKVLPETARVWIHNTATTDQGLANDVIDNIVSAFLEHGITIVERQMLDRILGEHNLRLEGDVADSDLVSIGNLAGANTIVVVGITGAGATRRLQVRVLNIETGTVIMQSGTGGEWNL